MPRLRLRLYLGQAVEYAIAAVRDHSEDMVVMVEWFERVGYGADIKALDAEFGPMTSKTLSVSLGSLW